MSKKGVVKIVSTNRTWYERLLASVFYAAAVYIIVLFYINNGVETNEKYYIKSIEVLAGLIVIVSFGVRFSIKLSHHFNLELNKYRPYWSVGPFGKGEWITINKLDRVSTFLNSRNECEVNVWDIENNKYKITAFNNVDDAVSSGRELSNKLNVIFKERQLAT